jgi:hypothetical protein
MRRQTKGIRNGKYGATHRQISKDMYGACGLDVHHRGQADSCVWPCSKMAHLLSRSRWKLSRQYLWRKETRKHVRVHFVVSACRNTRFESVNIAFRILKLFSPTNALYWTYKMLNLQLKRLCIRPYMFRSIWTIFRGLTVILAKVTLLQNYQ